MARKCATSGKGPNVANNVSHARNRNKKRQHVNLQKKRIFVPEQDRWVKIKVSARALRTISKKGLMSYLDDQGLELDDVTC
jgi:large subunit ribosomal protein L28